LEPVFLALEPVGCATSPRRRRSRKAPLAIRAGIALRVRAKLSAVVSILECMFESEACVADWERTGRVPVPARLLAPPDLTVWGAAGPPLVDEFIDAEILAGGGGSVEDGGAAIDDGSPANDAVLGNGCRSEAGPGEDASATDGGPVGEGLSAASGSAEGDVALADAPEWAGLAPGVVLASVLTEVDVSGLSEFALVEAVAGWERLAGWVAAEQAAVVAELAGRPLFAQLSGFRDGIDPVSAVGMEVSARLRVSHREADGRVVLAQEWTGPPRASWDALHAGTVDLRRARTLVEAVRVLDDQTAARVEARLLPDAAEHTPQAFRRRVERAVAAADPAGFEDRHARAVTDRQVRCR